MQGRSGKRGALLTFAILLTVSSGTAYAADPIEIKETTSIAVKDGASYSYGSDETESLTIAVENSDDGAAIAVDGSVRGWWLKSVPDPFRQKHRRYRTKGNL